MMEPQGLLFVRQRRKLSSAAARRTNAAVAVNREATANVHAVIINISLNKPFPPFLLLLQDYAPTLWVIFNSAVEVKNRAI
jgi:hypothetical protein